jgi:hypothetical protein
MDTKLMTTNQLLQSIAGELLVDYGLMVETYREEEDLRRLAKHYAYGDFTYSETLDAFSVYF